MVISSKSFYVIQVITSYMFIWITLLDLSFISILLFERKFSCFFVSDQTLETPTRDSGLLKFWF